MTVSPVESTCSLLQADIAFFPMEDKASIDYQRFLSKNINPQRIIGVATLPPFFSNRLGFFNEKGQTFFCKNIPLAFSFIENSDLEKITVSEYWSQVMLLSQKGNRPRIWILSPTELCRYLMSSYIKDVDGFYLHEKEAPDNHYYAIERNGDKVYAHFLF